MLTIHEMKAQKKGCFIFWLLIFGREYLLKVSTLLWINEMLKTGNSILKILASAVTTPTTYDDHQKREGKPFYPLQSLCQYLAAIFLAWLWKKKKKSLPDITYEMFWIYLLWRRLLKNWYITSSWRKTQKTQKDQKRPRTLPNAKKQKKLFMKASCYILIVKAIISSSLGGCVSKSQEMHDGAAGALIPNNPPSKSSPSTPLPPHLNPPPPLPIPQHLIHPPKPHPPKTSLALFEHPLPRHGRRARDIPFVHVGEMELGRIDVVDVGSDVLLNGR